MNKTITAPDRSGELLRAGKILTVTGNALVEWFEDGVKQGPEAVTGTRQFGPMGTDVQVLVSAISGNVLIADDEEVLSQTVAVRQFRDMAAFSAARGDAQNTGILLIARQQYISTGAQLRDMSGNIVQQPVSTPEPFLSLDFAAGYMNLASPVANKAVGYARNSVAWYQNENGVYKQYPANVPGFGRNGIIVEPPRTNVCTNHNATPNTAVNIAVTGGTLTAVEELDAVADAGLAEIVPTGQLYQFVNNSGATQTVTFGGQLGNSNRCAFGIWGRSFGSEATLQTSGGAGAVKIPTGKRLQRIVSERVTPAAATDQLQISVPNGCIVQFILNQLESFLAADYATALTSPIVTSGSSATRAGVVITVPIVNNDIVPLNNFTLYAEATPYSWVESESLSNGPALVAIHQGSPLRGLKPRGLGIRKQIGVEETATIDPGHRTKISPCWRIGEKNKLVVRQSATEGLSSYFNASPGVAEGITTNFSTTNLDVTNGVLAIGNEQDGGYNAQFTGEISRVCVYDSLLNDDQCTFITSPAKPDVVELGAFGPVFVDPRRRNRLWALGKTNGGLYDSIYYSDDYGDNWTKAYVLRRPTQSPTLTLDNAGNFYYLDPGTARLNRVISDFSDEAQSVSWSSSKGTVTGWSWLPWHWTIDNRGYIYTAAYSLHPNCELNVWFSLDNGATWTIYTTLVSQYGAPGTGQYDYRHFHSMKVNPFNNRLYLAFGDGAPGTPVRETLVSKAATGNLLQPGQSFAAAWDVVTDTITRGPTGITFMSDGAYFSSDVVGNQNAVTFIPALTAQLIYRPQNPYKLQPMYFIGAKGNKYLVVVTYNESNVTPPVSTKSAVHILTRDYIGGQWYVKKIIALDDANYNGRDYFEIGADSHAILDYDDDYVFVCLKSRATDERRLLRINI